MRAPTSAVLLSVATVVGLLTACDPASTPAPAATNNPSVGISTHSVVTSGSGLPPVPTLTGQTVDLADATAQAEGFYTTPEDPNGNTITLTNLGDWTVCSQTPAANATTTSNGIILTVVDTGAGKSCPSAGSPTTAAAGAVLQVSGNGIKNTKQFTTGDNWTINYTYDCSAYGSQGNFQVYVDYPGGDVPVNELGTKGASSSSETGAGVHSLKVVSECRWTLTVTNG